MKGNPANATPLITVVTVVRNGGRHLRQAVRSVIAQGAAGIEYIVVDGGSDDGSVDIIRDLEASIARWVSEPDGGIFDAMNKGVRMAKGRYVAFLNSDDWYEPGLLDRVRRRIERTPESEDPPVFYCDSYHHNEEVMPDFRVRRRSIIRPWRGMTVSHQALFVPRALYERMGGFRLEYSLAADYDMFVRLLREGTAFEKVDVCGVNYREGGASTRHRNRSLAEAALVARRAYGVFSKEYALFAIHNWPLVPIGGCRRLLEMLIGPGWVRPLRRLKRRLAAAGRCEPVGGGE